MAKKTVVNAPKTSAVIPQIITETIEHNFMPYAMSVILSRAIPEIDGFKPVHRKILVTMYNMGLLKGDRRKSADVVGQTMKLHPHGDMAIYETLVRLSRGNGALLHPYIDSKGNFGKQYSRDMAFAASRYTECKLDSICQELFDGLDKDAVDMIDNYDGSMKEPRLLPAAFPSILCTSNMGIAVGMASAICGFNLREIINATVFVAKNPDADPKRLLSFIQGPDFATGGIYLKDDGELRKVVETGRGALKLRAKYRYDKKASCIEIFEIPYTTTVEAVIDKIVALVKAGKMREIVDARDETGIKGLKIAVDIRKNADPEDVMRKLFRATTLQDTYSCNFNVLIDDKPQTLGVFDIIKEWLKFRERCVRRALTYELNQKRAKLHLLVGLSKIILDIDKAIRIIRNTEDDDHVIPNLCAGFSIDKEQAEYVAEIRLRNINKQYLLNRINETDGLKNDIRETEEILSNAERIYDIIIKELKAIAKKYGKDRITDVFADHDHAEDTKDVFAPEDYPVRLFLTDHGYMKKITPQSLRASSEQYLKDEDAVIQSADATNRADILYFTDKQNVYKGKVYELNDAKAASLGDFLPNVLDAAGERIVAFVTTTDYTGLMVFAFRNGKVAKVSLDSYATLTNRRKLLNGYSDKAPLVKMAFIPTDGDIFLIRDENKAALLNTSLIPTVATKNSQGANVLTMRRNGVLSGLYVAGETAVSDPEHYRTEKIPTTGHFLTNADGELFNRNVQLTV